MDEEQRKHIEELATWKKEAKAAQEKVRVHFVCLLYMIEKRVRNGLNGRAFCYIVNLFLPIVKEAMLWVFLNWGSQLCRLKLRLSLKCLLLNTKRSFKAGFHMIATIAAIAGKNVL